MFRLLFRAFLTCYLSGMQQARIKPPHRNKRLFWIFLIGLMLISGLFLIFQALGQNTQYFENPADVVSETFEPRSDIFNIGGLVAEGSVETSGLTTKFRIEDFERDMPKPIHVTYTGALPDLFREGQGVVISGKLTSPTHFQANEVLAKHDENYQPKIDYREDKS